jgi:hypothetical protein
MATYNNKPASVGLSDPKLVRQTETALAQASLIARGKPTVTSAGELILPNTTLSVGANSVSTTTSANNSSADVVTVYSGQGAIYASSIDQTVSQTIVNQVGVSSIVAGNNITITSTGTSAGTGIVTVNAVLDGNNAPGGTNTQVQFNDASVFGGNAGFTFNKTTGVLAAPFFSGPGNSLSNIQGTNVTGAVAFAGTANSVALANVSGAGNIASINLTGSTSNVLYGNGVFAAVAGGYGDSNVATFLASYGSNTMTTTGNVSVGNIIGNGQALTNIAGANVSGFVPNANVANTAFAVAAANVSGLGNIATINLDGNSQTWLAGNGVFANIAIPSVGNIATLNLDGNASNVLFGNGTFRAFTAFSSNVNGTGFNLGNVGNLGVTGAITATGNVTGGNIITGGRSEVTGTANTVGGGATVGVRSILAIDSAFGSNDANDPASAQAVRGRVTGSNLSKTRNYVAGVTGQYLVTGTNASEFINTGLLGVVGDQTTTANAAIVAYLDGDGGLTTAGSAYGVSMKNSTPGSGFDYGLDLQFINLDIAGTTTPFKQADIRFNNGVELVANVANTISLGASLTVNGNLTLPEGGTITNNIPPATFTILFQYDNLVWSGNTLTFTNASSTYMLGVLALMQVGDTIILGSTSTTVTGVYTGGGAGTFTVSGTGAGQQITQFTLPNRLTSVNGIKLTTNSQNYLFTEAGVTQSPVLTVDTLPSGQYAVAGFRAFVSDANLVPEGNFGAIVGNSGSNTVCVWCDGTIWRIG